jgi:EmrB/QacA subfamily drug resistance transporter
VSGDEGGDASGYDDPRRWWALGALALATLVLAFDISILNVALPTLAEELHASTGQQQWIIDAFLVVFAATMLPAGLLGDRFGRRRLLVAGLVIMLAGSVLGALAGDVAELIAARTVMGLGGALITPLAVAVLPTLFGPAERGRAIAALTAALATGMPLGPLIGGWLLEHYWWGSVFLINVPLVGIGIVACLLLLPESRDPAAPRVNALSTSLSVAGLGALVYGLIEGPSRGWDDAVVIGALSASVPLLALLVARERRRDRPILDIGLLRNPGFRWNALVGTLVSFVLAGMIFLMPQYLQAVGGHDSLGTGLRLMPMMAGLVVGARACPPLVRAFGRRGVVVSGLVMLSFAGLLGSTTDTDSGYVLTAAWLAVTGLGAGLALVPATDAAVAALPAERSGIGSGLLMTVRQVGSAIGVALLGSLLAQVYRDRLATGGLPDGVAGAARESVTAAHLVAERAGGGGGGGGGMAGARLIASADSAFVHGMSLALFVCGVAALGAAGLAALVLTDSGGEGRGGGPAAGGPSIGGGTMAVAEREPEGRE